MDKINENNRDKPADFEEAISKTGFGLFNFILLIIALPSCFATVYETSTMSYVLPSAECDLRLRLIDKGILNAITYAGMICSAIFWGYLADTMGRKKLLVYGLLLDSCCVMCEALSQNVHTLIVLKFIGGFLICGPFAVLMSYVTEFHGTKYRSIVVMAIGMFFSIATLCLPLLAWSTLPQDWNFEFFDKKLVIHSWQIFIAICGLPSLISGFFMIFLPESPKFLMSQGRNEEALKVFRCIYHLNTRKSKSEYPVKSLISEIEQQKVYTIDLVENKLNLKKSDNKKITIMDGFRAGLKQLKPMFSKQYLNHSIHVYTIQFCILLGLNTLRLWLPQLFTSITNFESDLDLMNSSESTNLCTMLEYSINKTHSNFIGNNSQNCEVKIADGMYINTIIVGISGFSGYLVAGALINGLGNKRILIIGLTISGTCGIVLYWAKNSLITVILSALFVTVGSISSTALLGVIVNLFPTSLRTMIVSLAMMFGRFGALIGNLLFPFFMSLGCFPPFLMVGSIMLIASFLCWFLPITHKLALK